MPRGIYDRASTKPRKTARHCKLCGSDFPDTRALVLHQKEAHNRGPATREARIKDNASRDGLLKRKERNGSSEASDSYLDNHTSYAFGHTQTWLDIYAESVGIPASVFTERVAGLLLRAARGKMVGAPHRMSSVRG